VEFSGALTKLRLESVVGHDRGALPYLVNGKNKVTVVLDKGELPKGCSLLVTYCYQEAAAPNPAKRTRWDGNGITYGPTKTVTKEIASLPFSFEIDVGGNTPPKMLSLKRALRGK
jgi:hypothetical protein